HLHAENLDVAHARSALVNRRSVIARNPEFVLVRSRRDVFVRARVDIGVHSQRDWRAFILGAGDFSDVFELRFTLDIETINALLERVFDFVARFTHARERALCWIPAGFDHAEKFAARNDVEPRTSLPKEFQDRAVRVRLDCVADEMIERCESGIETLVMIEERAGAIYIERRVGLLRPLRKIDIFAVKPTLAITKQVHE